MLGATTIWDGLGARKPGMRRNLEKLTGDLNKGGVKLVLLDPTCTEIVDVRSAQKIKTDLAAAREQAQEHGVTDLDSVQGPTGVDIATDDKALFGRYLEAWTAQNWDADAWEADNVIPYPNIGMVLDGTRAVVVDCPDDESMESFKTAFATMANGCEILPTQQYGKGGGGIYLLQLPDGVTLPEGVEEYGPWTNENGVSTGWKVLARRRVVPIAPSVIEGGIRGEDGPLTWHGGIFPAPKRFLDFLWGEAGQAGNAPEFIDPYTAYTPPPPSTLAAGTFPESEWEPDPYLCPDGTRAQPVNPLRPGRGMVLGDDGVPVQTQPVVQAPAPAPPEPQVSNKPVEEPEPAALSVGGEAPPAEDVASDEPAEADTPTPAEEETKPTNSTEDADSESATNAEKADKSQHVERRGADAATIIRLELINAESAQRKRAIERRVAEKRREKMYALAEEQSTREFELEKEFRKRTLETEKELARELEEETTREEEAHLAQLRALLDHTPDSASYVDHTITEPRTARADDVTKLMQTVDHMSQMIAELRQHEESKKAPTAPAPAPSQEMPVTRAPAPTPDAVPDTAPPPAGERRVIGKWFDGGIIRDDVPAEWWEALSTKFPLFEEHIGDSPEVVAERRRVRGMFPWLDNAPNTDMDESLRLLSTIPADNVAVIAYNGLVEWLHDPARGGRFRQGDLMMPNEHTIKHRCGEPIFEGDNIERIKATRNKKGWAAISRYYADGA